MRVISENEAYKLVNDESDNLPFRVINEQGKKLVSEWIAKTGKNEQSLDAWLTDAESAANNAAPQESVIVEMSKFSTISGNPETLRIGNDCFEWVIND